LVTALNDEKTLTLSKSGAYEKMLLLASSASGASTFDVILHFSDGTTNSTSFSVPDWFNGSGYAIKGIGRVKRTTDIYGGIAGVFEDSTDNPRLYDCFIDLSAYKTKLLTSISIKKTSSDGRTAILAVAGQKPSGAPETPVLSAANTVSTTGFTVNWDAVSGATDYCLDVAADSNFSSPITGYNNLSVGSVTAYTVTGLAAGTTYYVRVRAGNSNGYSFSSATQTTATLAASVPDVSGSNPASEDVSGSNPGNTSNAALQLQESSAEIRKQIVLSWIKQKRMKYFKRCLHLEKVQYRFMWITMEVIRQIRSI